MPNKKKLVIFLLVWSIICAGRLYGQTEYPSLFKNSDLVIEGCLTLEKHGQNNWLVLHARDAQTYLLKGALSEKLKKMLLGLGKNNLVSITGKLNGSSISCKESYQYETRDKGKKELKASRICIRYYKLWVAQILSAKKSSEEMPPPKRAPEEEKKLSRPLQQRPLVLPVMGEVYGEIAEVNLKSPVKTIVIASQDKANPRKNITLILSPDTRIAKKIGQAEPLVLLPEALKTGQRVTIVYSRDEFKSTALLITVTKE